MKASRITRIVQRSPTSSRARAIEQTWVSYVRGSTAEPSVATLGCVTQRCPPGTSGRGVRIAAGMAYASPRAIVRIVLIVVAVAAALYLVYLLRTPLSWLFMAAFVAIALSGPVNWLDRRMPRGLAIAAVYLALFAAPFLLGALVIPPLVEQAN